MTFTKVISKLSWRQNFAVVRKNLDGTTTAFAECRRKFRGLPPRPVGGYRRFCYSPGDSAYYKCTDCKEWRRPVKVLGQNGQQLLAKNGSNYIRVHICRLQLIHANCGNSKEPTTKHCNPNINHEHFAHTPNNNKTQHHTDIETFDSKGEHNTNNPIIYDPELSQPQEFDNDTEGLNLPNQKNVDLKDHTN